MTKARLTTPLAILLIVFCAAFARAEDQAKLRQGLETLRLVPENREQIKFSYAPLVKSIAPAVVNVYAARQVQQRRSPFAGDPFFERFFGRDFGGRPRQRISRSLGSGVIIGSDGIVVTNHHVIENADEVKVALSDGREYEARIELIDKKSDLAILVIEPDEELPTVELGDSEELQVGDLVLAIGNPFGVGQTVTSGIVSALARSQNSVNDFGFFVQTDASINPGNSGGALVDMDGRLIGVNTAIFTRSGGSNGIGFAVPSNMVRVVLESVRKGSDTVLRPWIGAKFQSVTSDIAESLGMARPTGALIAGLTKDGPAERAGLRMGDVILSIDGKPVPHMDALGYRLATAGIGRVIEMTVMSQNATRNIEFELSVPPEVPLRDIRRLGGRSPFTGATVANLSPRLALEYDLSSDDLGVVVLSIDRRSPAARFGIRAKDIIVTVNDQNIVDTAMLDEMTRKRSNGWSYVINRGGKLYRQFVR
ncbi:MAG: Do family serine endopeptidase [Rhizobiaceae bacterium]|nr:Do family serine endopeptidase [Rhizobiaceae bacterium]